MHTSAQLVALSALTCVLRHANGTHPSAPLSHPPTLSHSRIAPSQIVEALLLSHPVANAVESSTAARQRLFATLLAAAKLTAGALAGRATPQSLGACAYHPLSAAVGPAGDEASRVAGDALCDAGRLCAHSLALAAALLGPEEGSAEAGAEGRRGEALAALVAAAAASGAARDALREAVGAARERGAEPAALAGSVARALGAAVSVSAMALGLLTAGPLRAALPSLDADAKAALQGVLR